MDASAHAPGDESRDVVLEARKSGFVPVLLAVPTLRTAFEGPWGRCEGGDIAEYAAFGDVGQEATHDFGAELIAVFPLRRRLD